MEIIKCKKTNIIVFILSVIFLMSACAFGQDMGIDRISYEGKFGKQVTARFPSYGLYFEYSLPKKEYVFMNVSSDSINRDVTGPILYAYFPQSINGKGVDISITFADGTTTVFRQISCSDDNYAEFEITQIGFYKLRHINFKSISFGVFGKYTDEEKDFFKHFFKLVES